MSSFERKSLVAELWSITRPYHLKTADAAITDRKRAAEICRLLGVEFPEDAFERYGRNVS